METVFYSGSVPNIPNSTIDKIEFCGDRFVNFRGSKFSYSTNGQSWTTADSPDETLASIAYGNGVYVGVCKNGKTYYSSGFSGWTQGKTLDFTNLINVYVKFANGIFVVGYDTESAGPARAQSSSDGQNWSSSVNLNSASSSEMTTLYDLFVSGNLFYAVLSVRNINSNYKTTGIMRYSNNGVAWTNFSIAYTEERNFTITTAAANKNKTAAIFGGTGINSYKAPFYWYDASQNKNIRISYTNISSIINDGTQFLALASDGFTLMQSTNYKDWGELILPKTLVDGKILYGNGVYLIKTINLNTIVYTDEIKPLSMLNLWVGIEGKARKGTDMWICINGKARKVTAAWIGVDGKARRFF